MGELKVGIYIPLKTVYIVEWRKTCTRHTKMGMAPCYTSQQIDNAWG